ncbi:MAG: MATE family efflux transporter [Flavobacteriales bacterium]|jgi:putative MATE family efflux protein|nr:MATE family efflux transporter [Flavobacteriales bacterium]
MKDSISLADINKLAIPAILYNITEPLLGLVDLAIIGQIPEHATEAKGGVGLAVGLISTLVWGLAQVRTAISAQVGKYLGMNQLEKIKTLIPQSLVLSILLGVIFWLLTVLFYQPISAFLFNDTNLKTLGFSLDYYKIRAIGLPLSLFIAGVFGIFRGYQNTSWAMYISLIGGVFNLILDFILIHGIDGYIPSMGVQGAALASLIAQVIMFSLSIIFLLKKTPFDLKLSLKINPELKNTLLLTLNMLIRTLALNATFIIALRFANGYGKHALSAYAIGINIWLFSSFFIDGYSNAGNAIAGKLLGQKDIRQLKKLGLYLIKLNSVIATLLGLTYFIFREKIAALYFDNSLDQTIFFSFFWIIILAQPINSIAFTLDGIFKGLGEAKTLRNILLVGTFLIFIPLIVLFDFLGFNIQGIWYAFFAWMFWRAASLFILFKKYQLTSP